MEYRLMLMFLMVGIVTVYMDALTYPVMTLCVPLIFYLICTMKQSWLRRTRNIFLYGIYWAAGYAGMWLEKWAFGSVISGTNLFPEALAKLSERSGSSTLSGVSFSRVDALWNLVRTLFKWPYLIMLAIFIIALFIRLRRKKIRMKSINVKELIPFLFAACIPIAWILITANHCYVHPRLTYRNIGAILFALLTMLLSMEESRNPEISEADRL